MRASYAPFLAAAIALVPVAAPAQEPGYDCRALDLNGEGPAFRRADRNGTGYLSERELWRVPARKGGGWIAVDRNRDGKIAPPEFQQLRK